MYISSLLVNDSNNKSSDASLGITYAVIGALVRVLPNETNSQYEKTKISNNYSATDAIKSLQAYEKRSRYTSAGLLLIPLLLDFSGEKTADNPHPNDTNISIKLLSTSLAVSILIFKTPFEKTSEDLLKKNQSLSFEIQPSLNTLKVAAVYRF